MRRMRLRTTVDPRPQPGGAGSRSPTPTASPSPRCAPRATPDHPGRRDRRDQLGRARTDRQRSWSHRRPCCAGTGSRSPGGGPVRPPAATRAAWARRASLWSSGWRRTTLSRTTEQTAALTRYARGNRAGPRRRGVRSTRSVPPRRYDDRPAGHGDPSTCCSRPARRRATEGGSGRSHRRMQGEPVRPRGRADRTGAMGGP